MYIYIYIYAYVYVCLYIWYLQMKIRVTSIYRGLGLNTYRCGSMGGYHIHMGKSIPDTFILYIYISQFTRSPPLAPLAEQPWVARFFFLAIETWDVIASKIGPSKLHSIFTSPIGAPITGCAHRHRQRPQHPSDRTHQMSDIPRDQN